MTTLGECYQKLVRQFEGADIEAPSYVARNLILFVLGGEVKSEDLFLNQNFRLSEQHADKIELLSIKILDGVPLSRIEGMRGFWRFDFLISDQTLDPRSDSETLIEVLLEKTIDKQLRAIDFGTGSGCLLLSFLAERPLARGLGIDRLPGAIETAQENARRLGLDDRSEFLTSSWNLFDFEDRKFDVVIANPPYIAHTERADLADNVLRFDPDEALFADDDGLACYVELAPIVRRILTPEGIAVFEIGHRQADAVKAIMTAAGLLIEGVYKDLGGNDRCVACRSPAA